MSGTAFRWLFQSRSKRSLPLHGPRTTRTGLRTVAVHRFLLQQVQCSGNLCNGKEIQWNHRAIGRLIGTTYQTSSHFSRIHLYCAHRKAGELFHSPGNPLKSRVRVISRAILLRDNREREVCQRMSCETVWASLS